METERTMEFGNVLAGGALIGLLAGFWDKIKAVLWRVVNLVIQQVEIPSEPAHNAVVAYLVERYQRSRFYDRMFGAFFEHHRDGRLGLVPYEQFGHRSVVFWDGWRPFVFSNAQEAKSKSRRANNSNSDNEHTAKVHSTITFLRGTIKVETILREACARQNQLTWSSAEAEEEGRARFVIRHVPCREDSDGDSSNDSSGLPWYRQASYRLLAHKAEQLGKAPISHGRALDNLIFPQRVKDLIQEIERWRNSRNWYRDRAIPWKRGWLLYGPPGTGKTALARAFAEDLNLPIYVYNLAELGNHDLIKAWAEMQRNVPCIALFEDIDNVFHGRENVARKNQPQSMFFAMQPPREGEGGPKAPIAPLTFDCLLNCLDGVERADGIFTIITTNDISKVDPALGQPRTLPNGEVEFISTRPGRIDKAVELSYMEADDKKRLARRILGDYPLELALMHDFVDSMPDLRETPAQFQERCAQIALECYWRQQKSVQSSQHSTVHGERERKQPASLLQELSSGPICCARVAPAHNSTHYSTYGESSVTNHCAAR